MDVNDLMKMAGQLRDQLRSAQDQAQELRARGEAGGGLVKVVMNGQHEVLQVSIDPGCFNGPQDLPLLQDLLRAAVNQAVGQVASQLKESMGGMAKGFGVDLSALDGSNKKP